MQEWKKVKLGDIVVINKGKQKNKILLTDSGDYPVINGGIYPSGYADEWNAEKNTISISEGGNSCGFVNFNPQRFWAGGHCYTLQNHDKSIDYNYLFHYLKFYEKTIMNLRVGSGLPNIQKNELSKFKVHFPISLVAQKKIAELLSNLDIIVSELENSIKAAEKQKKGLMKHLLSKGTGHSDFKDSEFGKIPREWNILKLSDVADIYDGTHQTPKYIESGVKFVSVEDIKDLYKSNKYISSDDFQNQYKYKPQKNDILMTRIGDIGTVAYIDRDEEIAYYVTLALIKSKSISSPFLYQFIKYEFFQKELYKRTLHIAFPKKINLGEIGKCKLIVPTDAEQGKISEILVSADDRIQLLKNKKIEYENLKQGLMQQLLTGKIRVE